MSINAWLPLILTGEQESRDGKQINNQVYLVDLLKLTC